MHFVAARTGAYADVGLDVTLVDLRAGELPHDASVACGAAHFAALAGAEIRIWLIASAAPLFWLYGRRTYAEPASIASYPPGTPPARFLALALGAKPVLIPARDDAARLALVASGQADYALLSSATPPPRVEALEPLFCLADRVPVPSTGVATEGAGGDRVLRLVSAHRRALGLIAEHPALAREGVREAFGFTDPEAAWILGTVRRHFTPDGRLPLPQLNAAMRTLGLKRSPYAPGVAVEAQLGGMPTNPPRPSR